MCFECHEKVINVTISHGDTKGTIGHLSDITWDTGLILGNEMFFAQRTYNDAELEGVL